MGPGKPHPAVVALPWDLRGARRCMDARPHGPTDAAEGGPKNKPYAAARPPLASCQGVRIRGPEPVIAIVNSKWAASEPSWE